jgi:flavin-dependent dehydrogenase
MSDKIAVIGGGLAGLISAILLARNGDSVTLFEKKQYPFHKVCGEYLSNELIPFLRKNNLFPDHLNPSSITQFQFSSIRGRSYEMPLDLGGFGVSRYALDSFLLEQARAAGVTVRERETVTSVNFATDHFELKTASGIEMEARFVIGAYGKNGNLDKKLNRNFTRKRSPYIGVKYHVRTDFPTNKIALHNFDGGYCGLSSIENEKYNLCYLGSRESLRTHGSIEAMEAAVLKKNPYLNDILSNSEFLFKKPEVINEFSFKPKSLIENHILMSGDTAGLITPLCGNGMAIAIHSAKMLAETIISSKGAGDTRRSLVEKEYQTKWNTQFKARLWRGRQTQLLFGSKLTSEIAVSLMKNSSFIARQIMKGTHGEPF